MKKIMILGDSSINPRSFPQKDRTELEETYPYILKERYKEFVFWQLALGGVETELLVSQAASYLVHWNPDIIIVHSGIIDCFPRSFSAGEILVIQKLSRRLFRYIKKYLNHPSLIKWRQKERASKKSFQKTAKKLKAIFKNSTIFWMEICAGDNLEERAPGLKKRKENYNAIIRKVYGDNVIPIAQKMREVAGYNSDGLHLRRGGHKAIGDILVPRIDAYFNDAQKE